MPISLQLEKDIKFISCIDPQKNSVSLTYNQRDLKREKKRSCFHNFLRWFIHIISFTLVPRNAALDKIALRILNNVNAREHGKGITSQEKKLLNYSIKKLLTIIRENGGRYGEKINKLLQSIQKIDLIVQELDGKPEKENPAEKETIPEYAKKLQEQITLLEQGLNTNQSVVDIIADVTDLDCFLNLLNEETQAKLLLSISIHQNEKSIDLNVLKKFLIKAVKIPIEVWEHFFDKLHNYKVGNTFLTTLFSVLDAHEDLTYKWRLFDLICRKIIVISALLRGQPVINGKLNSFYAVYICMLSEKQRQRLGLKKYEIPLQVLSAIKHRKLNLPECRQQIIEQIKNFTLSQKNDFLIFLTSIDFSEPFPEEKISHLLYFLVWLDGLQPQLQIFEDCIQICCSEIKSVHFFSHLAKAISNNTLKIHLLPSLIKKASEKNYNKKILDDDLIQFDSLYTNISLVCPFLKVQDVRIVIDENWNFISNIRKENTLIFIRYLDEAQKLKSLLPEKFYRNNSKKSDYFEYFEIYPWKLYLLLNDEKFHSPEFREWIKDKNYPTCNEILNKYDLEKLTAEEIYRYNVLFQEFFALARNHDFVRALQIYNTFEEKIKEYFLAFTRHAKEKNLYYELPYLNEAQLLVSLLDEESNINMCQSLADGLKKGLLTPKTLSPILNLTIKMKNALIQDKKVTFFENFLSYPLEDLENENFKINNDPSYSDMIFKFSNETVLVHRVFLNLNPDLREYIPIDAHQTIVVNDDEATKIKLALKQFYNFQLKFLIPTILEIKKYSLNNYKKDYLNEDIKISEYLKKDYSTYWDMKFKFSNETIYVHRAFLNLDPDLHKYIPINAQQTIVINDHEEAIKIKIALLILYHFQVRDLLLANSEIEANFLYNNQLEDCENENFKISKCYNDPTFSDMLFEFNNETVHVHRAFLSLNPELQIYIPIDHKQTVVVNDNEEATKIRAALKRFYNFQMRDLILPRSEVKSLYNNQQTYPDFVVACGKEEIHVHRVMLATYLPFFQNMFNTGMQEAQKSRMEIPADEFDRFEVVKLVLEYIYTHEMPDFEDEASAQAFKVALDFYRPGVL